MRSSGQGQWRDGRRVGPKVSRSVTFCFPGSCVGRQVARCRTRGKWDCERGNRSGRGLLHEAINVLFILTTRVLKTRSHTPNEWNERYLGSGGVSKIRRKGNEGYNETSVTSRRNVNNPRWEEGRLFRGGQSRRLSWIRVIVWVLYIVIRG